VRHKAQAYLDDKRPRTAHATMQLLLPQT
jgi:hypothetical protein